MFDELVTRWPMMHITYAISLWNFTHYAEVPDLVQCLALLREQGYGVELWAAWRWAEELNDPARRRKLRPHLAGMTVSLHTAGVTTIDEHQQQIDLAAELGAGVLVLHPADLRREDTGRPDVELAHAVVAYADQQGVRLALENGQLPFIAEALASVPGLNACLDIGHIYLTDAPMQEFLAVMKPRLIHLHLQDILTSAEAVLPGIGKDHYIPGTGGIPRRDWILFSEALHEIDYVGSAVFEIRPRTVLQTALLGRQFVTDLFAQ